MIIAFSVQHLPYAVSSEPPTGTFVLQSLRRRVQACQCEDYSCSYVIVRLVQYDIRPAAVSRDSSGPWMRTLYASRNAVGHDVSVVTDRLEHSCYAENVPRPLAMPVHILFMWDNVKYLAPTDSNW